MATGILFQRDNKGRPARRAKILRDILRFSLNEDNQFNQKELSLWLVNNCNAFEFEPHTPNKNKPYIVSREIGPLLEQLSKLGLIRQIGLELEKNGTKEFAVLQYTTAGRLLTLIIDSSDLDRKLEDNHKIYEILRFHHTPNKSSRHQFFLHLLAIYHQQNCLDDITEIIRRILEKVTYIPYNDLMDIYEIVKITLFTNPEKAKIFLSNWRSALNNLEPHIRSVFLYDIKLEFESRMGDHKDIGDPRLYEEYRFELRGNPEDTALQARCSRCNIVQNLSYKTSSVMIRNMNEEPLNIKCPKCNNTRCLVIPTL